MIQTTITTSLAALGVVLWLWRRPLGRARIDWLAVLARIPLPMLALAASYGVYSFARLFVPEWVAVVQAAAFECTYIGLAVTRGLDTGQRKRAVLISLGAVAASIVYNMLSGWFERQPQLLDDATPIAWLWLAILHGAPLAWVAYLISDLLLHSTPAQRRPAHRAKLARVLWRLRGEARGLRGAREDATQIRAQLATIRADRTDQARELEQLRAALAQQRADLAHLGAERAQSDGEAARAIERAAQIERELEQIRAALAQAERELAQSRDDAAQQRADLAHLGAERRELDQVLAQTRADLEIARAASRIEPRDLAPQLIRAGLAVREVSRLLGISESTIRGWLKASSNGHAVESS